MKKAVWYINSLLLSFCAVFFLKYDLVEANQIYEATEFIIGSTITNDMPEYMNYYKLHLSERKTIKVTCIGYSNQQDIYRLYLYDSDFEEMDCDDPYGLTITNGARKESKKYTLDPGTYYIAVQDNNTNMIKYTININYVDTNTLWNYYGSSFLSAKQLLMGDKLSGLLRGGFYKKAVQYYKIKLNEKTLLSLNFVYAQTYDEITVTLFNSSYNQIEQFRVTSEASSKKMEKTLKKGTYYITTYYGYNTNDGVDYGFSVRKRCLAPKLKFYKEGTRKIKGTTMPNAKVTVKVNKKSYSVKADRSGSFKITLKAKLKKKDKLVLAASKIGFLKSSKKTYKVR